MKALFHIDSIQAIVKEEKTGVVIVGWYVPERGGKPVYHLTLNDTEIQAEYKCVQRPDVRQELKEPVDIPVDCGFCITGFLPEKEPVTSVVLTVDREQTKETLIKKQGQELEEILCSCLLRYSIDNVEQIKEQDGFCYRVNGWAILQNTAGKLKINAFHKNGEKLECRWKETHRADLDEAGLVGEYETATGFVAEFASRQEDDVLVLSAAGALVSRTIDLKPIIQRNKSAYHKLVAKRLVKSVNGGNIRRAARYVLKHGFKGIKEKTLAAMTEESREEHYQRWYDAHKATQEELAKQRAAAFAYAPKISILVPTYHTPPELLREMIESVISQSYGNWELCIGEGSEGDKAVEAVLEEYHQKDPRVIYRLLKKNKGISGNTNEALAIATGDFIGLLDHDDLMAPNALYEVVCRLQDPQVDIVYTDEDKIYGDHTHVDPNFKPDFSMDLFRSHNYITHFFVARKTIVDAIGGFRSEFDGSQDYDLMFRCIEKARRIVHIPKILYHWRMISGSTAEDPAAKMYCYEAGKRAIEAHLERIGVKGRVEHVGLWGMYHVIYDTAPDPLVSIIIPNKDHTDDLDKCIRSIMTKSAYRNFEIIVVENNSDQPETFAYYKKLEQEYSCVKVVYWKGIFNYSAINNFGAAHSEGEYLLLLNNDTELISENAIGEMLGICMRKEVGIVGAKLLFADDTVQHAGIVLGFGGFAGHVFSGIGRNDYGYMVRARINCNYSAVTGACLLTKRSVYEEVGGLTEDFVVALNDVDYCLKAREKGYLVVYAAFAEWYHYESKSRGYEDTPEKQQRFMGEVQKFRERWQDVLDAGDPFYNVNFPVTIAPFTLP